MGLEQLGLAVGESPILLSTLSCIAIIQSWLSSDTKVSSVPWAFLKRNTNFRKYFSKSYSSFLNSWHSFGRGVCTDGGKRDSDLRKTVVGGRAEQCMKILNLMFGWLKTQSEVLGRLV